MPSPLIHIICGSTGAGKTTYALALADRIGGVRFSIDEWMRALFWMDSPQPLVPDWSIERVERCYAQIWATARRVAERGVPCVLDLGFSQKASRAHFAALAREARLGSQLHFLDVPSEARWQRVQRRNARQGGTRELDFEITRDMFDFVEGLWEAPDAEEMASGGLQGYS